MLRRLLAMIRPGFVTDPILEPRMTASEVLALAAASVGPRPPGQELVLASVHLVDGRLVWTVSTSGMRATTFVTVDDATGAVGPVTHRGLR